MNPPPSLLFWPSLPMPHKHNADRRHHIPKTKFEVENWRAYEAGQRRRGGPTLWITDEALDHWQTRGPGGQARYSDVAIQTHMWGFPDLSVDPCNNARDDRGD